MMVIKFIIKEMLVQPESQLSFAAADFDMPVLEDLQPCETQSLFDFKNYLQGVKTNLQSEKFFYRKEKDTVVLESGSKEI